MLLLLLLLSPPAIALMADHQTFNPFGDESCILQRDDDRAHRWAVDAAGHIQSDADEGHAIEQSAPQSSDINITESRRGQHSREGTARRQPHADQAAASRDAIAASALARACGQQCTSSCTSALNRNEMLQCLEYSYGTIEWISDAALKVWLPA